ncbi:hypothetical protein B0H10DRAFT_2215226 [Mycena sp. CBHHK59/15]|nr:hypothetical protein B0H10DRAFT_2215226 [Mycena sp. CBHHK59/15]
MGSEYGGLHWDNRESGPTPYTRLGPAWRHGGQLVMTLLAPEHFPWSAAVFFGGIITKGEPIERKFSTCLHFDPCSLSRMAQTVKKPAGQSLSKVQKERRRESRRAASARYRECHRSEVLEAGRIRAAQRRAYLASLSPGDPAREAARLKAREASARYHAENRELLALKQRKLHKKAFIKKHGVHAYIQRRFDAPPGPEPEPEPQDNDDDGISWPVDYASAPLICDYDDPCLKRY